ncbi:hypothetical protein DFH07DRAFT_972548 [Mycena maculata]|uniref:BTB domain-containing protein n=1 Tax=Mycena maculata TaxID=230809 RepID=A0AAD7HHY4_9AGAR|nr:hypothetical protein DFH07DRAFT_972548 [Mycena maculata]
MERLTHPGAGLPVATTQGNFRYVRGPSAGSVQILDPETELELERHADLWFKDGVLSASGENTVQSPYLPIVASLCLFRTIFTLPQPSRPRSLSSFDSLEDTQVILDECENCPLLFLHDTAEDVANFLAALYDGPNFGDNGRADFGVVSGVLRLSTKYIVDALAQKALAHLSIAWPSTLKGWDAREDLARSFELETSTSGGHFYPSPIAVINLAREVNAPSLLPAAFYDLCRYSYAQIYDRPKMNRYTNPRPLHHGPAQTHIRAQTHAHIRKNSSGGICVSAAACRKDFSELVDLATQHYLFDRERAIAIRSTSRRSSGS